MSTIQNQLKILQNQVARFIVASEYARRNLTPDQFESAPPDAYRRWGVEIERTRIALYQGIDSKRLTELEAAGQAFYDPMQHKDSQHD